MNSTCLTSAVCSCSWDHNIDSCRGMALELSEQSQLWPACLTVPKMTSTSIGHCRNPNLFDLHSNNILIYSCNQILA